MNPTESSKCILLVDDELLVRDFASTLLRQSGYSVLPACNAAEALHISCGNARVDVLLTDVEMGAGRMNGFELAARVMKEHPGIQVVIMSGLPENESLAETNGLAFLSKPFQPATLIDRVREVLSGIRAQPESDKTRLRKSAGR